MHCPNCKNGLSEKLNIGAVEINKCPKCRGLWFDKDELRKAKDEKAGDAIWFDVDLWKDGGEFQPSESVRNCPACNIALYEIGYGDSGIRIDACKKCYGIWLDRGELQKIVDYVKEKSDRELLNNYLQSLMEEAKEVFVGPENMRSEIVDLVMVLKLFKYKFAAQHPTLIKVLSGLPLTK